MKSRKVFSFFVFFVFSYFIACFTSVAQTSTEKATDEELLLQSLHSIYSQRLFDYVKELTSDKYAGRLTGTPEYKACAEWVASLFKEWGVLPAGEKGTYFQEFPIPYTLVFKGCEAYLDIPYKGSFIKKHYRYEDEFIPGSTSGSGKVSAEVVYVGYGITAPELNFDEYDGVDVKGKIVLMEREVPVSPNEDPELFKKWRPYSFHQYKLENAVSHDARGMIYNYGPIANPNNSYDENFIYSHVGDTVVADIFTGTGRTHEETVEKIKETLKPQSFSTGKTFTLKNITNHYLEGIGSNVIGMIEGSDPEYKNEVIIVGGHLDHLGRCYEIMPGANDNASAVAVILGVAEVLAKCPLKPRRSVVFICFGAEEQGVVGSKYYLEHPLFPLEKTVAFFNMDGVGCGDKLSVLAAENYPSFWKFIEKANKKYIHRIVRPRYFSNIARPRLDAARFMWKGIPTVSISARGAPSYYHITKDDIDTITPEILEDLAQLVFVAVLDMADEDSLNFRHEKP
ncbi:MAG: M28 family peptidase [Candidatus Aminicenantaceae bacterium]